LFGILEPEQDSDRDKSHDDLARRFLRPCMDRLPSAPPLVVYPGLWLQAVEQHPDGLGYDWRERWRCLCRLARESALAASCIC
jgi:hypothetical protein